MLLEPKRYNHQVDVVAFDAYKAAEAYHRMEHTPSNPKVAESYALFKRELLREWLLINEQVICEFTDDDKTYPSSKAMLEDVNDGHLYTLKTTLAHKFSSSHPMLEPVNWQGQQLVFNDIFRAVHDVYGHYRAQSSFSLEGEKQAWLTHRTMFPKKALLALWCETRGQAAWTNCWANHPTLPLKDRPFAQQKAGAVQSIFV